MMSISELVETDGWKKFMAKVYGWGASVNKPTTSIGPAPG